jgi:hypothetical protein
MYLIASLVEQTHRAIVGLWHNRNANSLLIFRLDCDQTVELVSRIIRATNCVQNMHKIDLRQLYHEYVMQRPSVSHLMCTNLKA